MTDGLELTPLSRGGEARPLGVPVENDADRPVLGRFLNEENVADDAEDLVLDGDEEAIEEIPLGAEDVEELALLRVDGRGPDPKPVTGPEEFENVALEVRLRGFAPGIDRLHVLGNAEGHFWIDPAERPDDTAGVEVQDLDGIVPGEGNIEDVPLGIGNPHQPVPGQEDRRLDVVFTGEDVVLPRRTFRSRDAEEVVESVVENVPRHRQVHERTDDPAPGHRLEIILGPPFAEVAAVERHTDDLVGPAVRGEDLSLLEKITVEALELAGALAGLDEVRQERPLGRESQELVPIHEEDGAVRPDLRECRPLEKEPVAGVPDPQLLPDLQDPAGVLVLRDGRVCDDLDAVDDRDPLLGLFPDAARAENRQEKAAGNGQAQAGSPMIRDHDPPSIDVPIPPGWRFKSMSPDRICQNLHPWWRRDSFPPTWPLRGTAP